MVWLGSDSDLKQCISGLEYLSRLSKQGIVICDTQITASIHRNTYESLRTAQDIDLEGIDIVIIGAGWANHLTGTIDAFLRYTLQNSHVVVVGVSFEDTDDPKHTRAAKLSVSEVPGTQVVFGTSDGQFVGEEGFLNACQFAVQGDLPMLKCKEPPKTQHRSIEDALKKAHELKAKAEEK